MDERVDIPVPALDRPVRDRVANLRSGSVPSFGWVWVRALGTARQ